MDRPIFDFAPVEPQLVERLVEPGSGTVVLAYEHFPGRTEFYIYISTEPWRITGLQPVRWDLLLFPLQEHTQPPLIRIVAERNVEIGDYEWRLKWESSLSEHPRYSHPFPILAVHRVQMSGSLTGFNVPFSMLGNPRSWQRAIANDDDDDDIDLFGIDPFDALEIDSLFGPPYMMRPEGIFPYQARLRGSPIEVFPAVSLQGPDLDRRTTVLRRGSGRFHGDWEIELEAHREEKGGYAFDIRWPGRTSEENEYSFVDSRLHRRDPPDNRPVIDILATQNVAIRWRVMKDGEGSPRYVRVRVRRITNLSSLPDLGESLESFRRNHFGPEAGGGWVLIEEPDFVPTTRAEQRRQIGELIAGLALGPAWDALNLGIIAATGRDLWGYSVRSAAELEERVLNIVMGATDVIPGGGVVGRVSRGAFRAGAALSRQTPRLLLAAGRQLSSRSRSILISASRLGSEAAAVVIRRLYGQLTGRAYQAVLRALPNRVWLSLAFKPNLSGFRNPILQKGYGIYKAFKRKRGQPVLNPLEWAKYQSQGRYAAILERELGSGNRQRLHLISQGRSRLNRSDLTHFERYGGQIQLDHEQLRAVNTGRGKKFNSDHFFEKRFIKLLDEFLEREDTLPAHLVPSGPDIMADLKRLGFDLSGIYPHTLKTTELRRLIPNGNEHLFTMQDLWDAHVDVYLRMGVSQTTLEARLKPTFEALVSRLAEEGHRIRFEFRFNIPRENLIVEPGMGMRGELRKPNALPPEDSPTIGEILSGRSRNRTRDR